VYTSVPILEIDGIRKKSKDDVSTQGKDNANDQKFPLARAAPLAAPMAAQQLGRPLTLYHTAQFHSQEIPDCQDVGPVFIYGVNTKVTLLIFKVAFSTFWFNPYGVKPSGAIAERGTSHVA